MSQTEQIKNALVAGMKITTQDAIKYFGCTRLAARIKDLEGQGMKISRRWKKVPTRLGVDTRVMEYWL